MKEGLEDTLLPSLSPLPIQKVQWPSLAPQGYGEERGVLSILSHMSLDVYDLRGILPCHSPQ